MTTAATIGTASNNNNNNENNIITTTKTDKREEPEPEQEKDSSKNELESHQNGAEILEQFSEEQLNELKEAFQVFDKDGSESITNKELGSVMRSLGQNLTEKEIRDIIKEVDEDGNGTIEFTEFLNLITKRMSLSENHLELKDELEAAFKVFDRNNDGQIPANDIRYLLGSEGDFTEDEIEEFIANCDSNKDGFISLPEFLNLMLAK